jgi:excisionase family DNA binding protein
MDKAAAALGISRRTAYELVKRGELRTVLIGRRRLVSSEALREYAAGLASSSGEAAA